MNDNPQSSWGADEMEDEKLVFQKYGSSGYDPNEAPGQTYWEPESFLPVQGIAQSSMKSGDIFAGYLNNNARGTYA